jgi:DNA-binding PucR family transcriptional regulator
MANKTVKKAVKKSKKAELFAKGSYALVRTYSAGVWFGKILERDKKEMVLADARMLWSWVCIKGISLAEIAEYGAAAESRICSPVTVLLTEVIQVLAPTKQAIDYIVNYPVYEPK